MAVPAIDQRRFPHISCIDREPRAEAYSVPSPSVVLVQKVREIEKELLTATITPSDIPEADAPVLHRAITILHQHIRVRPYERSWIVTILEWAHDRFVDVSRIVYKVALGFFRKAPQEVSVRAILEELKLSMAITPSQYEAVLRMSCQADKKPAVILLSTFLGFPTAELSPLLTRALGASAEYAFSLLLECSLIKKFSTSPVLRNLINNEDRTTLFGISIDNLESFAQIKEQLRTLRSLSYRLTIRSWLANLPDLLQARIPLHKLHLCYAALKDNDPTDFTQALSSILLPVASLSPITNETLYAKELLQALSAQKSFDTLATEIRTQKFFSLCCGQLRELKKASQAILTAEEVSQEARTAIKKSIDFLTSEPVRALYLPTRAPLCTTFRATQTGAIARTLRKVNTISERIGKADEAKAARPAKHILNLLCSCGGGHKSMVRSLGSSLEAAAAYAPYQFSAEELDVPLQVTQPVDSIHNIATRFGLNFDASDLYNFLLRNDLCSVIDLLRRLFSGAPDSETAEKKHSLIRQAILAKDPDLLNLVYSYDGTDFDAVSQELGLPLLYVATDFDLDEWKTPPTSPFFKEAVPSLHDETIRSTLRIPIEKTAEVGLCVGPDFERVLTPDQLAGVRKKYHIALNEKIVLFSSGGAALQSTIPERIARDYHNSSIPVRLLIVCGANAEFKSYLEQEVVPTLSPTGPVTMTVLGLQTRASMAALTQVSDAIIGKPGGLSSMEFLKTGARVVFDETSFRMKWERLNAEVVTNHGQGVVMTNQDDLIGLLSETLRKPRHSRCEIAQIKGSEQYTKLVSSLLGAADQPKHNHGWREKRRSWHALNKRIEVGTIW